MNQDDNDMSREVDFRGGVRGKYLARYQRWAGITTAEGAFDIAGPKTSRESDAKIVVSGSMHKFEMSGHARDIIAPEVSTASSR